VAIPQSRESRVRAIDRNFRSGAGLSMPDLDLEREASCENPVKKTLQEGSGPLRVALKLPCLPRRERREKIGALVGRNAEVEWEATFGGVNRSSSPGSSLLTPGGGRAGL
jgi:hypothetical protein